MRNHSMKIHCPEGSLRVNTSFQHLQNHYTSQPPRRNIFKMKLQLAIGLLVVVCLATIAQAQQAYQVPSNAFALYESGASGEHVSAHQPASLVESADQVLTRNKRQFGYGGYGGGGYGRRGFGGGYGGGRGFGGGYGGGYGGGGFGGGGFGGGGYGRR